MQKHILFVSTSNLATNPRLVKEIELALDKGYSVTAVVCKFHNWSYDLNEAIKQKLAEKIHLVEVTADRSAPLNWIVSTIVQKIQKVKLKLGFSNLYILSDILVKRSILLRRNLKKLKNDYQLVIAHNPGAFEPSAAFAKRHGISLGIDVEDYHPGETSNPEQAKQMQQMMQKILPQAAYVSAAAPLILEAVQKNCAYSLQNTCTILNFFHKNEFIKPVTSNNEKLRFVWFSQNIDAGRGLEPLLFVLKSFKNEVQLHLYGNVNSSFFDAHLAGNQQVVLHTPVPQEQLHRLLAVYDVGIALEDTAANFNRTICLTNKLLAYYQAGLYILATDTPGQQQFLRKFPTHGIFSSFDNLHETVRKILEQKSFIRSTAISRYSAAASFHAKDELNKLGLLWDRLLGTNL